MKYYKKIIDIKTDSAFDIFHKIGIIRPEDTIRIGGYLSVKELVEEYPKNFVECTELEYYEQEGYLPEDFNWCIRITGENREDVKRWNITVDECISRDYTRGAVYGILYNEHYVSGFGTIPSNSTEITYSQFKRLVLKQKDMKEIIGYKLKSKKYFESAKALSAEMCFGFWGGFETVINTTCSHTKFFREEKVLDLWFEPVYANSTPDITINGYKAEFLDNYVKFGCAEISYLIFVNLYKVSQEKAAYIHGNKQVESVTIGKGTFTKEQIKEIAEYYNNK